MNESLGLVEISGMSTAIVVADAMAKSANIKIVEIENSKGLGYMTIKITGDIGAVNAAVSAGKQIGITHNNFVSSKVIPRPSDFVYKVFGTTKEEKNKKLYKKENKNENVNTDEFLKDYESSNFNKETDDNVKNIENKE